MREKIISICIAVIVFFPTCAQNNSSSNQRLKVFIDCKVMNCQFDYIRSEIKFVDHVNDRYAANVYILITSSNTGGGGQEYKLFFEGLENFKSVNDTLSYVRNATETNDEDRKKMVQYLKLGLVPFIARTSMGTAIQIIVPDAGADKKTGQSTAKKDKWNSWIFKTAVNGNFNGDDNYKSSNMQVRLSAGRVTEKLKLNFSTSYSKDKFRSIYRQYDDNTGQLISTDTTQSTNNRSNFNGTIAVSINSHWSGGLFSNFYTSTFDNIQNSYSVKPALEYSIFPYKTFTTKYMGFLYKIGPIHNNYVDSTWRDKTKEWLLQQNLSFDLNFNQKWGSVSASFFWSNYFFDWKWYNYGVFANGQFRIIKGLNFNFYGGFSITHDQVELQKGNATQTQVLIRQRLLRNNFGYFTGFGLSYQFGSIFNNVVNPRLGEAGGGNFFFSN